MKAKAFTIVELLVVIALIVLLAALLLPVVQNTRKRAQIVQCINQLHQIGQAIQMYRADYEHQFPSQLIKTLPYVKSDAIFICPSAPNKCQGLISEREDLPTCYWTVLDILSRVGQNSKNPEPDVIAARILMEQDPNHGVAVCFLHGVKVSDSTDPWIGDYIGRMLRLRVDSSVQHVNVDFVCTSSERGGVIDFYLPGWYLYTDVRPCPDIPGGDTDSGELDCPPTQNVVPCPEL